MKLEQLLVQTKKHYPSTPVNKEHRTLSAMLKSSLIEELTSSPYQLPQVRNFLEKATEHFLYTTGSIALHVIASKSDEISDAFLKRIMKRVQCLSSMYAIRPLEFWLIPCNIPKTMPLPHEHIAQKHMNGGYTYPSNGKIYIYRFEEFPKVMLHETLHHSPMDTQIWNARSLHALYTFFNISWDQCPVHCSTNILPNEAVVETWAEIYQLIFMSMEMGVPLKLLWEKELQSAILQTAKLLKFQEDHTPVWKETTHAFSYIVLRSILLWNIDAFLELEIPYSSAKLSTLMIDGFQKETFQKGIQYALSSPAIHGSSLRMTRFGDF